MGAEVGDRGSVGPGGQKGYKGPNGAKGKEGPDGQKGSQGLRGAKGIKGPTGDNGAKGIKGAQGSSGPKGSTGGAGSPGGTGPYGPKGQKGGMGSFGPTGPPGGGDKCLPYGTQIKMADGTYKNVEDLVAGDMVQAYNIDGLGFSEDWYGWSTSSFSGTAMTAQVMSNPLGSYGRYYMFNNTLKATNEHAILIKRAGTTSFEAARDVVVGDQMLNESYQWVDITAKEEVFESVYVANPDVEDVDNYFASGFLVHNPKEDLVKDDGGRSDGRLKAIQGTISNALAKVKQMESYYFYSNDLANHFGYDRVEEGEQRPRRIGLIAQELLAIEPNLVERLNHLPKDEGQDGYYTINYNHLNALLIEAIKELEARAAIAATQAGL